MRSMFKGLGLLVGLMAGVVACGVGEDDSGSDEAAATQAQIDSTFDVNDVSILFPISAASKSPYPQVRVSGVGLAAPDQPTLPADQQLWSKEVFNQVIAEAKKHELLSGFEGVTSPLSDFFSLRGLWHIVGLRFDPCAPGLDDAILNSLPGDAKGKCIIQFRLITQPFREGETAPEDFTAHLVYNLGSIPKSELATNPTILAASKLLGQIKDASAKIQGGKTAGQPLGVHPGLESEIKKGGSEVAGLVRTMIKSFTTTPSRAIAFMGLQSGGPEPWTFFAGKVEGNKFTPQAGPAHGAPAQTLSFIGDGPVVQKSRLPVNTAPLFDIDSDKLTDDQRKLGFKVENPKTQHFFNTDCISCHTSSSRNFELSLGDKGEISARTKAPKNVTAYIQKAQAQDSSWNVRNFGYFGSQPTVSGRTLTETAEVVEWFNTKVRAPGAALSGPGPDCSAVDDAVWKCFRDGKSGCLTQCKPAPVPTSDVPARDPVPFVIDPTEKGDPCVTATVGGAPTVEVSKIEAGKPVAARLGGNDSQCLSRVLGGSFVTDGLVIACSSPTFCLLSIAKGEDVNEVRQIKIKGEELKRLRQFVKIKNGDFFESRASGAGVQIFMGADEAIISISEENGSLGEPGTDTQINP